jgi:hypothetical protein
MLDKLERMIQERLAPETLYGWFQISPVPPDLEFMAMTTPTEVVRTTMHLKMKNHFNLWGGVRRIGNWMDQNMKWETIC